MISVGNAELPSINMIYSISKEKKYLLDDNSITKIQVCVCCVRSCISHVENNVRKYFWACFKHYP